MRKIRPVLTLTAFLAATTLSMAKDPIDAQIEKTGKLKNETLAEAIRWEKAKLAAAERESRKSGQSTRTSKSTASKTSSESPSR